MYKAKSTAVLPSAISNPAMSASKVRPSAVRPGFTVLELLVVIGIIVLMAAILVPVVSQVRIRAQQATTEGEMERIMTACINYYHDFNAYPGPIADSSLQKAANAGSGVNLTSNPQIDVTSITSSENLALGLLGFLSPPQGQGGSASYTAPPPTHDVQNLNYLRPASFHYIDFVPEELTAFGIVFSLPDGSGRQPVVPPLDTDPTHSNQDVTHSVAPSDSPIPEFQDHFSDPLPILYMRARVGAPGIACKGPNPAVAMQYDIAQLAPYGFMNVSRFDFLTGPGQTPPTGVDPTLTTGGAPIEWSVYLMSPGIVNQPRGKDSFVLISAGPPDVAISSVTNQSTTVRLYGTKNNIIVTP